MPFKHKDMNKLILFFLFIAFIIKSDAQIVYTDINPDSIIVSDPTSPGTPKINTLVIIPGKLSTAIDLHLYPVSENKAEVHSGSDIEVLMDAIGTYPMAVNKGFSINSSGNWREPADTLNYKGNVGHWINVKDKYLAFRIKNGSAWHYGWLRMDINTSPDTMILKDYAYNDIIDSSIIAGNTVTLIEYLEDRNSIKIFPNPCKDKIHLLLNSKTPINFSMSTIDGRIVIKKALNQKDNVIDLSLIGPGVYNAIISSPSHYFSKSIIIQ